MMILAIRGFDAVQRAKKPKTQVIKEQNENKLDDFSSGSLVAYV